MTTTNSTDSTRIDPRTHIGRLSLTVASLDVSLAFYENFIGFQLHRRENGTATLGAGGVDLLHLVEQPGAQPSFRHTGLFHFAILVPSRFALAHSLKHLAETRTPMQGYSDHGVSEALYLADPDQHGIEIYRDRPREEWPVRNGELQMVSDPLDIDGILGELAGQDQSWRGLQPGTIIGHMHLRVAHIPPAEQFYSSVVGFDVMQRWTGQASFLSAGGYHHHLGMNTWGGVGVPPPPPDASALRWYEIRLPDREALDAVLHRVETAGLTAEPHDGGMLVRDPSSIGVLLTMS